MSTQPQKKDAETTINVDGAPPYDHRQERVDMACGISQGHIFETMTKMRDDILHTSTYSEKVQLFEKIFTKRELAYMVIRSIFS